MKRNFSSYIYTGIVGKTRSGRAIILFLACLILWAVQIDTEFGVERRIATTSYIAIDACDSIQFDGQWYNESTIIQKELIGAGGDDSTVFIDLSVAVCAFDTYCPVDKVRAADGTQFDAMSEMTDIFNNWAIAGAANDGNSVFPSGSAYVFKRDGNGWSEYQKLTASDMANTDRFGSSVAIAGDRLIVGAQGKDVAKGAAYIFKFNGNNWVEEQKIVASDGAEGDAFGCDVAINGNMVAVSAHKNDSAKGAVYIYEFDGSDWLQSQKLIASDGNFTDDFGSVLALSGEFLAIGAQETDESEINSGSVYIFQYNGNSWLEKQKLSAPDPGIEDRFGRSVDISADRVIVGAPFNDDNGTESGSAYIFKYNGSIWNLESKLLAFDGQSNDEFGDAVGISAGYAVVGAFRNGAANVGAGAAYLYKLNGASWQLLEKSIAQDADNNDAYGVSCAISGTKIIIGSRDSNPVQRAGAVYFLEPADQDIIARSKLSACDSAFVRGQWYYSSQVIRETIEDATAACSDSIYEIDLAISSSVGSTTVNETVCDDFSYNGITHYNSGIYPYQLPSSGTCGDLSVLNLTVNHSTSPEQCLANGMIVANDGAAGDFFGYSVAIEGNVAAIGAYGDEGTTGSVYVYEYNGSIWQQKQKLTGSQAAGGDRFGFDVEISRDFMAVSSYLENDQKGVVYIFKRMGGLWIEHQRIEASDGVDGDFFGRDIGLWENHLAIGAIGDDRTGGLANSGAVYFFKYDPSQDRWIEEQIVFPSVAAFADGFGGSVAISGRFTIIGEKGDDDRGNKAGAAFIYEYNLNTQLWEQKQKLFGSNILADDEFGIDVDIAGNVLIVGAPALDASSKSGQAYVFEYNGSTWIQKQIFVGENGDDHFGESVSIEGRTIVIGANQNDESASNGGSAYIYQKTGANYTLINKLVAADASTGDGYGFASGISGMNIIVGAHKDNTSGGADAGSAYFFKIVKDTLSLNSCNSIDFGGQVLSSSGLYSFTYNNVNDCDSFVTLDLIISGEPEIIYLNENSCGDQLSDTSITDIVFSSGGCDSIIEYTITTYSPEYNIVNEVSTNDESEVGVTVDSLESINGCDSLITTITTLSEVKVYTIILESCNPAEEGITYDTIRTGGVIDSIIQTITELQPSYTETILKETCVLAEVGEFTDNLETTKGCDSIITTIVTLREEAYEVTVESFTCLASEAGIFEETLTSSGGCDSVVISIVELVDGFFTSQQNFTCNENEVGTVVEVFESSEGCDSTVTTNTILLPSYNIVQFDTTCILSDADTVELVLEALNGCDSIIQTISIFEAKTTFVTDTFTRGNAYTLPNGDVVFEPGSYEYSIRTPSGCDSVVLLNLIDNTDLMVSLPTAFTPNDDGFNDILYAYSNNLNIQEFEMSIYDRIGELVFQSNDINVGWNGDFKGRPMNSGVFIVFIRAKNNVSKEQLIKQQIKLIR